MALQADLKKWRPTARVVARGPECVERLFNETIPLHSVYHGFVQYAQIYQSFLVQYAILYGMDENRRRGILRIHADSIIKALYGTTEYKALSMKVSTEDRNMLEITVSHTSLAEVKVGNKLPRISIERKIENGEG